MRRLVVAPWDFLHLEPLCTECQMVVLCQEPMQTPTRCLLLAPFWDAMARECLRQRLAWASGMLKIYRTPALKLPGWERYQD